jgi:hypothetical protein
MKYADVQTSGQMLSYDYLYALLGEEPQNNRHF